MQLLHSSSTYRHTRAEAVSEKVLARAKGIVRPLACDALPEPPAGIRQHTHCHDHKKRVPKTVVAHQDEGALHEPLCLLLL